MIGQLLSQGHLGFGNAMQGATDSMWKVNQANQNASIAKGALGGGGPQQSPRSSEFGGGFGAPQPWERGYEQYFQKQLEYDKQRRNAQREMGSADFENNLVQQRVRTNEPYFQSQNQWTRGFLGGMLGGGQGQPGQQPGYGLPTGFQTNYGAFGSLLNPQGW